MTLFSIEEAVHHSVGLISATCSKIWETIRRMERHSLKI